MAASVQETQFTSDELLDRTGTQSSDDKVNASIDARSKGCAGPDYFSSSSYGAIPIVEQPAASSQEQAEDPKRVPKARAIAPDLLRGLLMALQAIDHSALFVGAWQHGTALESEGDGNNVYKWNFPVPYIARTLTHLCAPGFMFLLGMGIVYFGQSRSKLGWTTGRMALHFITRAFVLAAVSEILGLVVSGGQILVLNIVLLALAVNYLLAGLLWMAVDASERTLAAAIDSRLTKKSSPGNDELRPLLDDNTHEVVPREFKSSSGVVVARHIHNSLLALLVIVTIWWNVWLSPDQGHCAANIKASGNLFRDFWFYVVQTNRIVSVFPPLAWVSFATLGVLYGRIVLMRPWPQSTISVANAMTGLILGALFVLTRLTHFGNLSEDCLHMPEHVANPNQNQYLTSVRAFFYITKYPPSPSFFALTMSVNFLLMALFGSITPRIALRIPLLMTFGTSALFFYVLHLLVYTLIGIPVKMWLGHPLGYENPMNGQPAYGVGNTAIYWVYYFVGLALLYPLCRWYGRFKASKGPDSVFRFF